MLDKLKKWYELLGRSGINSKAKVREEIKELIKIYESSDKTSLADKELIKKVE